MTYLDSKKKPEKILCQQRKSLVGLALSWKSFHAIILRHQLGILLENPPLHDLTFNRPLVNLRKALFTRDILAHNIVIKI